MKDTSNDITLTPFATIGADERGITQDFTLPRKQDQFIYITRKAGTVSGNTYHTGKSPATQPKVFLLLSGEIRFSWRNVTTNHSAESVEIREAIMITIQPYVTHQIEVIKDAIMIECNAIADIQDDRIREAVDK